jgi:5-methylcytosine-specific restriction enzyme A
MRRTVLDEEPLCRACLGKEPPQYVPSTIADHIRPKAEGGTDERDNYQGICGPCHRDKTARESGRGRRRRRTRGGV